MKAKFYDCFVVTKAEKLDHMENRILALRHVVEKFIVVLGNSDTEPTATHPLVTHKDRFKKYGDQVVFVTPTSEASKQNNQNAILEGLKGCKPDDIIHFARVAELPHLGPEFELACTLAKSMPIALVMTGHFMRPWNPDAQPSTLGVGSCLTTYSHLVDVSPRTLRHLRKMYFRVYNTGTLMEPQNV